MYGKLVTLFATVGLVFALGLSASAIPINQTDTFSLSVQNGALVGTGPWGTVYVTGTPGGGSTITIEFLAPGANSTPPNPTFEYHNAGIGWNVNLTGGATISSETVTKCITVGGATCSSVLTDSNPHKSGNQPFNFSGFGDFMQSVTGGSGSSSGMVDVVITITGANLTTSMFEFGNNVGTLNYFAAQVSPWPNPNGGCTGWVSNTGALGGNTTTPGSTCEPTNTPEPSSVTLLGAALVGLIGVGRKLFR